MLDHRRPLAAIVAISILLPPLLGGRAALAQVRDVFEVKGVAVDVTADTAAAARVQALADGERIAYGRLLRRLVPIVKQHQLPDLGSGAVAQLVKDFSVAEEKTSAVRYLAKLDIRFKGEEIRRLLIDYAIPFAETPSKPLLVLPVYQEAGALLLFDDPNPWRDAWGKGAAGDGLVPLVLPLGDLADIAAIGAEQAISGDGQRLAAVARRYGAGGTLVAHATLRLDPLSRRPNVEVYLTRYGSALQEQTFVKSYTSKGEESLGDLLARAAADLSRQVQDNWKNDNLLRFTRQAVVAVTVRIDGLGDWLAVRERLGRVAVISKAELVLLSRDEVRVNLHYIGEPEQLSLALEQADLAISRDGDDWILTLIPKLPAEKT
jgi:hypothetical protein